MLIKSSLLFVGFVLLLLRKPEGIFSPFLWAEDGSIFLQQFLDSGINAFTPYAGQLWLQQRITVAATASFGLIHFPVIGFVTSTAITVLMLSVILQNRAATVFGKFRYQALAFFTIISLPGIFEATNGILSTYLFLPFSLGLMLLFPSARGRWGIVAEWCYLGVGLLTSLTSILILPITAWVYFLKRDRQSLTRFLVVGLAAMLALTLIRNSGRPISLHHDLLNFLDIFLRKSVGILQLGSRGLDYIWPFGSSVFFPAIGFTVAFIYLVIKRGEMTIWLLLITGLMNATLGMIASPEISQLATAIPGGRYFIALNAIVVATLVILLAKSEGPLRFVALVLLLSCFMGFLLDFSLQSPASLNPATWLNFVSCYENGELPYCSITISPGDPWKISLSR
jgi:hypothetical protein